MTVLDNNVYHLRKRVSSLSVNKKKGGETKLEGGEPRLASPLASKALYRPHAAELQKKETRN